MTKRQNAVFSFAVLLIAAIFTMVGCGGADGGPTGGGGIPVKMKAFNNNGVAQMSQSLSMFRAVGGEGGLARAPRAVEDASFNDANNYYTTIGTKVGSGITPDQFNLVYSIEAFLSDGRSAMLAQNQSFDFANDLAVPIDIGDVPADITVFGFKFSFSNTGTDYCTVQFEKPADITKDMVDQCIVSPFMEWDGNMITTAIDPIMQNSGTGMLYYFVSYGDTRKLVDTMPEVGIVTAKIMVTPFTPRPIPDGASSVSLNVSWDLNNIIEQWTGANGTANDSDDLFVFKKGWWNNVYVTASVQ